MLNVVQGGRRFAVERDIVNIFWDICAQAGATMAHDRMPPAIRAFAEHHNVTNEDLCTAFTAMRDFINLTRTMNYSAGTSLASAWSDSGLGAVSQPALVAMFSAIGMITTNAYHVHMRKALPTNVPTPGGDALSEMLERAAHAVKADDPSAHRRRVQDMQNKFTEHREDNRCDKG